jgi:hypothetical protein
MEDDIQDLATYWYNDISKNMQQFHSTWLLISLVATLMIANTWDPIFYIHYVERWIYSSYSYLQYLWSPTRWIQYHVWFLLVNLLTSKWWRMTYKILQPIGIMMNQKKMQQFHSTWLLISLAATFMIANKCDPIFKIHDVETWIYSSFIYLQYLWSPTSICKQ